MIASSLAVKAREKMIAVEHSEGHIADEVEG